MKWTWLITGTFAVVNYAFYIADPSRTLNLASGLFCTACFGYCFYVWLELR